MALMYPDTNTTRVIFSSRAEEVFYQACRHNLSDTWSVYYSRTLSTIDRDNGMKDNEIDFVLYHRGHGVVVIEVKGGRIRHSADSGKFYSINRYGERFSIKDPFQQALVWKSRFWRVLRNRNIKVPVSHAVAFPSVNESEIKESAAITPAIVIGRRKMNSLSSALKNLVAHVQPEQHMKFDDVADALHEILWGKDFTSKLFLKDYLNSHDLRVRDIEVIQETLVQPIAASARLAIEGEAGTGKTLIALLLARHFRSAGKRVLLLTSNRLLNTYLRSEVGANVEVKSYTEFGESFGVHLLKPPRSYKGKRDDWSQYEAPDQLVKAITPSKTRYDVLICDEAQDVQPFWWEPLETALTADDRHFFVFFDRSQGIFGAGGASQSFEPESVLPIAPPYFPLVYNYRTTREIASFSRDFRTGSRVIQSHCGRLGYIPEIVTYDDAQDCRGKLGRLFRKLFREEGVATDDVTLLSARNPNAPDSVLKPTDLIARYGLRYLGSDHSHAPHVKVRNKVDLSTISGFKGLETPIAILLNVSEYNLPLDNAIMASLVYVACTRAKHMLYIMVRKDDPKRAVFESALKAVQSTGGMVLEGSDANFEFVGTVSHYNPDRIGWLEVSDPAFGKSSIMFFPHDAESAGLKDLKSGDKLRFRLHIEGRTTIAADLKLMDKNAILVEAQEALPDELPTVEPTVVEQAEDQSVPEQKSSAVAQSPEAKTESAKTRRTDTNNNIKQEDTADAITDKPKHKKKHRSSGSKNSKPDRPGNALAAEKEVALPDQTATERPDISAHDDNQSVSKEASVTRKKTVKRRKKNRSSASNKKPGKNTQ